MEGGRGVQLQLLQYRALLGYESIKLDILMIDNLILNSASYFQSKVGGTLKTSALCCVSFE